MLKRSVKVGWGVLLLLAAFAYSLLPLRQTEGPYVCLHMLNAGGNDRLEVLVKRFAAEHAMSAYDSSKDIKLGKSDSNLLIHVLGDDDYWISVSQFMDEPERPPQACFYGIGTDQQSQQFLGPFAETLDKEEIAYESEHRVPFKEKANLVQLLVEELARVMH